MSQRVWKLIDFSCSIVFAQAALQSFRNHWDYVGPFWVIMCVVNLIDYAKREA